MTFFDKDFTISLEVHRLLVRHLLINGADSIYLFGPNGEGAYFIDKLTEKIKLISLCSEISEKKAPLLVGVYGYTLDDVIEQVGILGKKFNEISFVIMPPHQVKIDNVYSYLENVLTAVNVGNNFFIHNDPKKFSNNEINPQIVNKLTQFDKFIGLIDSFDNINHWKSYLNLISDDFSFSCGSEENLQKFFQIVPTESRKLVSITPCLSNIVNLCSKLYLCATEEKVLEIHQLQEQINDIRNKIYDFKSEIGKEERGLKYAFYSIYRNNFPKIIENYYGFIPKINQIFETITKNRIEATINYMINQKQLYLLYFLGKTEIYQLDEIINAFSKIDILLDQGKIKKVIGLLNATKNTIYRVNFEKSELLFRFHTTESLENGEIIKEKLLYPLIDNTLDPKSPEIREKVKEIIYNRKGCYIFNKENPPIIPVGNLIYFDESKEIIPYIFSVNEFIPGISLLDLYNQYNNESFNFSKSKFVNLFFDIGELLGKLHQISFDSFDEQIHNLGKKSKTNWNELFNSKLNLELSKLKKFTNNTADKIDHYFKENNSLIEEECEPVLIHNDYQWSNLIVEDSSNEIKLKGVIDFDNWGIGVRAQDFVRIQMEILNKININDVNTKFYEGYRKYFSIKNDFLKKIEIYSLFKIIQNLNMKLQFDPKFRDNFQIDQEELYKYGYFKQIEEILNPN